MPLKSKKYCNASNEELLLKYKANQENAIITEIYKRFAHLMMGLSLKYLKRKELAEDNVMQIFEKLPKLLMNSEIRYLKSWLYMVTKNECLMYLRKRKLNVTEIKDNILVTEPELLASKELLEIKIELVYACLKKLKPHHEMALRYFYLEKKSYAEIAKLLNKTVKQIKSDVQNGKRNLKLKLQKDVIFKSAQ